MDDKHSSRSSTRKRDDKDRERRDRGDKDGDRERYDREHDRKRRREDDGADNDSRRDKADVSGGAASTTPASAASSMKEIADTIKEANKLRAELGMPLLEEVDEAAVAAAAAREAAATPQQQLTEEEAARAAEKEQQTLEVMAKIEKAKKKRQQTQVIGKSLGEELAEEDEGVLAWVMKHKIGAAGGGTDAASKAKQKERDLAKRTARMLDDADKQLGEGDEFDEAAAARERAQRAAKKRRTKPSAPVPSIIAHRPEDLQEGEVVMVLRDTSVLAGSDALNEDEDELENINLLELQKAKEYQERKKKKPIYDVYGDFDSSKKSILAQYDDKPDRVKFKLDDEGRVEDTDVDAKLDRVRERLNANRKMLYDLSGPATSLASEFLSHDEVASSFKKRDDKKKKRRKLRKKPTTAELIEAMETEAAGETEDHGSRAEKSVKQRKDEAERSAEAAKRQEGWAKATERAREEARSIYGSKGVKEEPDDEDVAGGEEDDLYSAVSKARRVALTKRSHASVAQTIAESRAREEKSLPGSNVGLVLSDTTEFCASLTTEGLALKAKKKKNKQQKKEDDDYEEAEPMEEEPRQEAPVKQEDVPEEEDSPKPVSGFRAVEPGKPTVTSVTKRIIQQSTVKPEPLPESVVPEEPLVAKGLAATLQLLNQQGGQKALELDSVSGRARDKVLEIPDSDDPAPRIRLDKFDEFGRKMTQREAFRHLSHKFHGKMPGKKKTEKRLQRYEEELKKKKMSSLDTPLNSLQAMQKAQEVTKAPYLVLSSTSTTVSRGLDLTKPQK